MKIGILTLPLHTNYGGILQAWALQTVLERMGHEVKVINLDRTPSNVGLLENIYVNLYGFFAHLKHGKVYIPHDINKSRKRSFENHNIKTQYTQIFVEKYIHNYYVSNYTTDIKSTDFDCIVVGSDQIWSHIHGRSINGCVSNAYLPFMKSDMPIRFSYAASFGKENWEYTRKETKQAKESIKLFRAVSVRESSGIGLCKKYFDVDAVQHVDPTMLLSKEDYIKWIKLKDLPLSLGNMLVYLIDSSSEKNRIVDYIENELSLSRFIVNSKAEDTSVGNLKIDDCIQPPVEKWLKGFMDADFIVTDSFHACVFSILFHKPFIAVGNSNRGIARFHSLLLKFGLENRLVLSLDEVKRFDFSKEIDFVKIEEILKEERDKSNSYLKDNLS